MENIGNLNETEGRFEFRLPQLGLVVRGNYPEWVLSAAAEIISKTARIEAEAKIEEVKSLIDFGEASDVELDSVKWEHKARFDVLPQCVVSLGQMDYRWADEEARKRLVDEFGGHELKRLHDMSLVRDGSFLDNEEGVEMAAE